MLNFRNIIGNVNLFSFLLIVSGGVPGAEAQIQKPATKSATSLETELTAARLKMSTDSVDDDWGYRTASGLQKWPNCNQVNRYFNRHVDEILRKKTEEQLIQYLIDVLEERRDPTGLFSRQRAYRTIKSNATVFGAFIGLETAAATGKRAVKEGKAIYKISDVTALANRFKAVFKKNPNILGRAGQRVGTTAGKTFLKATAGQLLAKQTIGKLFYGATCGYELSLYLGEEYSIFGTPSRTKFEIPYLTYDVWKDHAGIQAAKVKKIKEDSLEDEIEETKKIMGPDLNRSRYPADETRVALGRGDKCEKIRPVASPGMPLPTKAQERECTTLVTPLYQKCLKDSGAVDVLYRKLIRHPLAKASARDEIYSNALSLSVCLAALQNDHLVPERRFATHMLNFLLAGHFYSTEKDGLGLDSDKFNADDLSERESYPEPTPSELERILTHFLEKIDL